MYKCHPSPIYIVSCLFSYCGLVVLKTVTESTLKTKCNQAKERYTHLKTKEIA